MTVLALDCAGAACAVALWQAGQLRERVEPMVTGHAVRLLPLVQELLTAASVPAAALTAIVAITGPGSFTGMRIACAAAEGMALALGMRGIGIDAFAASYAAVGPRPALLVVRDSRRDDFYGQRWVAGQPQPACRLTAAAFAAVLAADPCPLTGDGAVALWEQLPPALQPCLPILVPPESLAAAAARLVAAGEAGGPAQPFYLREADISAPRDPLKMVRGG